MSNGRKDIAVATIKKCDNSFQVGITQAKIIDGFIDIDNNKSLGITSHTDMSYPQ